MLAAAGGIHKMIHDDPHDGSGVFKLSAEEQVRLNVQPFLQEMDISRQWYSPVGHEG